MDVAHSVEKDNPPLHRSPTIVPVLNAEGTPASNVAVTEPKLLTSAPAQLLNALKALIHHGVDADIPVPKIIMVGDQSAGKSTLVEALTNIHVPRGESTCTRCPLEINIIVEPGAPAFSARVSLLKKFRYQPDGEESHQEFKQWTESDGVNTQFFMEVADKEELVDAIRLAQYAVLTPDEDSSKFKNLDISEMPTKTTVSFSPNTVVVEIRGEEYTTNLSFVDLPGIISHTKEGAHVAELVKNLAIRCIRDENALICLVVSMAYDIMVSQAHSLVFSLGAMDRTIGVLTKPDKLDKHLTNAQWMEALHGKEWTLGHGYFVTKQPQKASDTNHKAAREEEMAFFKKKWIGKFPGLVDRLGTVKLGNALSAWLLSSSHRCLPQALSKIEEKLDQMDHRLEILPKPHREPRLEVQSFVQRFMADFTKMISHDSYDDANIIWMR
jgi:GTPase SAR1 family protein